MAGTGLSKRVRALEGFAADHELSGLSDNELRARIVDVIEKIGANDLDLPGDWRERLKADPLPFLKWCIAEIEEALACVE